MPVFQLVTRALQPVATCRQSPYLYKPAIVIMTSFASLAPVVLAAPVLIMTSFATELATCSITDERALHTDTLARLLYKD